TRGRRFHAVDLASDERRAVAIDGDLVRVAVPRRPETTCPTDGVVAGARGSGTAKRADRGDRDREREAAEATRDLGHRCSWAWAHWNSLAPGARETGAGLAGPVWDVGLNSLAPPGAEPLRAGETSGCSWLVGPVPPWVLAEVRLGCERWGLGVGVGVT